MMKITSSIIIAGRIYCGKSTLAKAIAEKKKLPITSFDKYRNVYCKKRGIKITTRQTLQESGNPFAKDSYLEFLENFIRFSRENFDKLIFEGITHKTIRDHISVSSDNCFTIFLDVPRRERYKRMAKRGKDTDAVFNFEDFVKFDKHPLENEIDSLKEKADLIIGPSYDLNEILKKIAYI